MINELDIKEQLEKEGFKAVNVSRNQPGMDFGRHTHDLKTVQVVINGKLIIENNGKNKIIGEGQRVEFPKGTTHISRCGPTGCDFMVGFMQ